MVFLIHELLEKFTETVRAEGAGFVGGDYNSWAGGIFIFSALMVSDQ